jgi:2-keto-4-pentenoate hydratase
MDATTRDAMLVREVADRIESALATGQPVPPVRNLIGAQDIEQAYAVQHEVIRRRVAAGGVIVGRKIGLTARAVQHQLGVNQPDFGFLFADMDVSDQPEVPMRRLLQPKVEAEVAFVLKGDLVGNVVTAEQVADSVDYAVAALEIVDSRIADWDLTIADTVADNASSGLFVLGENRLTLDAFAPREVTMQMTADGESVSRGSGLACLGDPLLALLWLARTAAAFGEPLRAGQVILSGALGPMATVTPGVRIEAELKPIGTVSATFPKDGYRHR